MVVGSLERLVHFVLLLPWLEYGASYEVRPPSLGLLIRLSHRLLVLGIRFWILRTRIWLVIGSKSSLGIFGVTLRRFVGGIGDLPWWLLPCRRCNCPFHPGTYLTSVVASSA